MDYEHRSRDLGLASEEMSEEVSQGRPGWVWKAALERVEEDRWWGLKNAWERLRRNPRG